MRCCSEIVVDQHYSGLNPVIFGYEECLPSHTFGPAVREYWLLHYVVSGFGVFEREGQRHTVHPGELFVIQPHEETIYSADAKRPWSYIWIGFTAEQPLPVLLQPVITVPEVGCLCEDTKRCTAMDNGRSAFLSGKLWEVMGCLLERGKTVSGYIEKAVNCMQTEYMYALTVQEIADRLSLDRSYFTTLFRQQMGITPRQYLNNLRMEKAAALMIDYEETPSTAAASTGYTDIFHFSKMFKQHFGVSPRIYIEQHRGQR